MLLCRVGALLVALPGRCISETMRPLPVEPLIGAPAFVCGLSLIRGDALPVVDAGRLLGQSGGPPPTRFVTVRTGQRLVALAVDAVLGMYCPSRMGESETPALLSRMDGGVVSEIGALDTELLIVLKATKLVPAGIWEALDARGGVS